jgi:long-chain acyl-CoA synthetase
LKTPVSYSTPLEVFCHWEMTTPDATFLKQPVNDKWIEWSYKSAGDEIRRVAAMLKDLNLPPQSNIAMLSKNCAHFIMTDIAIWMAGHVSVPLYPTISAETINSLLEHCNAKVLFVGKLDNFSTQRSGIPSDIKCISFTLYGEREGEQWSDVLEKYQPIQNPPSRKPEELATIKYTSGTTGKPKGVMIDFQSMHFVVTHALPGFGLIPGGHRFFSYLPLSHIAERMLIEIAAIYLGASISFAESLDKFPKNLMETQPTLFLGVPRIWAKFRDKVEEKMPNLEKLLRIPIISSIIKKAIRKKLGLAKAIWCITGAAPISVSLLEWFDKLGIHIHEGYAMTENVCYSHFNLHEVKFGTVGNAWPEVAVKISDEGEILLKHKGLMLGYYKDHQLTQEAFTSDGYLKTGDKGVVDADGFLAITGRIKDQFKTDKAKYIDPAPIELKLMSNPDIEQVCVVGTGIPQPIALAVLSAVAKAKTKEQVHESISATLSDINAILESYSKIKTAVIVDREWTVENGLMTPSMKVKRNEVEKIYSGRYKEWYDRNQVVQF